MKVSEVKQELKNLRLQNSIYKQNCISALVIEFRESYKKHRFIRRILKFLSKGRLCQLDHNAWSSEILQEVSRSFWYREIIKFHAFHEAEIDSLDIHVAQLDENQETPREVLNMIRIIREVIENR